MAFILIPTEELEGLETEVSSLEARFPGIRRFLAPRIARMRKRVKIPTSQAKKMMEKVNAELIQSRLTHVVKPAGLSSHKFYSDISGSETIYTNMKKSGELPWDEKFEIKGLFITIATPGYFYHSASVVTAFDYINELVQGYYEFYKGDNLILEGHLSDLFAAGKPVVALFRSLASAADHFDLFLGFQDPVVAEKGYFPLPDGPTLEKSVQFRVQVTWDSTIDSNNPFYLKMVMIGNRVRPIVR